MNDYEFEIWQTALFKKKGKKLKEVLKIEIESRISGVGILTLLNEKFEIGISKGKNVYNVEIPEIEEEKEIEVVLSIDKKTVKKNVKLEPQKKWKIYILFIFPTQIRLTPICPAELRKNTPNFLI